MKTTKIEKTKVDILKIINGIAPEKLSRALAVLDYMVLDATSEERKAMHELAKDEEFTLDMMVEWVNARKSPSLSGVAI